MLLVVVVVIVAVSGGGAVAWYTSRGDRDEVSSIRHYHHALRTLEDVTHRTDHPAVRALRPEEVRISEEVRLAALRQPAADTSPVSALHGGGGGTREGGSRVAGLPERPDSGAGGGSAGDGDVAHESDLVFDEVGPARQRTADLSGHLPDRPTRTKRRDLSYMERPRMWRSTGAALVVAALVAASAFSVAEYVRSGRHSHVTASAGTPPPVRSSTRGTSANKIATAHTRTAVHHATIATTAPMTDLSPVSPPSAFAASYAAPSAPYALTLMATGPCWVLAQNVANGAVIWTGTLHAGQVQPVITTGTMTLRLGAPGNVVVKLGHDPVLLPAMFQAPFTETFTAPG